MSTPTTVPTATEAQDLLDAAVKSLADSAAAIEAAELRRSDAARVHADLEAREQEASASKRALVPGLAAGDKKAVQKAVQLRQEIGTARVEVEEAAEVLAYLAGQVEQAKARHLEAKIGIYKARVVLSLAKRAEAAVRFDAAVDALVSSVEGFCEGAVDGRDALLELGVDGAGRWRTVWPDWAIAAAIHSRLYPILPHAIPTTDRTYRRPLVATEADNAASLVKVLDSTVRTKVEQIGRGLDPMSTDVGDLVSEEA